MNNPLISSPNIKTLVCSEQSGAVVTLSWQRWSGQDVMLLQFEVSTDVERTDVEFKLWNYVYFITTQYFLC